MQRQTIMHRLRFPTVQKLAVVAVVALVATIGALAGSVPTAVACSYLPPFGVPIAAFAAADDGQHLNAPDGPLAEAFQLWKNEWFEGYDRDYEGMPAIVGVHTLSSVVVVEPPSDTYSSDAAVVVYEQVWGQPPSSVAPYAHHFDPSSCAGDFPPPALGEPHWVIATEPLEWYVLRVADSAEQAMLEAELSRLFGEPLQPQRDAEAEQDALDQIFEKGRQYFETEVGSVTTLDESPAPVPTPDPQPPRPTEPEPTQPAALEAPPTRPSDGDSEVAAGAPDIEGTSASISGTAWLALTVTLAAILGALLFGWTRRRSRSSI